MLILFSYVAKNVSGCDLQQRPKDQLISMYVGGICNFKRMILLQRNSSCRHNYRLVIWHCGITKKIMPLTAFFHCSYQRFARHLNIGDSPIQVGNLCYDFICFEIQVYAFPEKLKPLPLSPQWLPLILKR